MPKSDTDTLFEKLTPLLTKRDKIATEAKLNAFFLMIKHIYQDIEQIFKNLQKIEEAKNIQTDILKLIVELNQETAMCLVLLMKKNIDGSSLQTSIDNIDKKCQGLSLLRKIRKDKQLEEITSGQTFQSQIDALRAKIESAQETLQNIRCPQKCKKPHATEKLFTEIHDRHQNMIKVLKQSLLNTSEKIHSALDSDAWEAFYRQEESLNALLNDCESRVRKLLLEANTKFPETRFYPLIHFNLSPRLTRTAEMITVRKKRAYGPRKHRRGTAHARHERLAHAR